LGKKAFPTRVQAGDQDALESKKKKEGMIRKSLTKGGLTGKRAGREKIFYVVACLLSPRHTTKKLIVFSQEGQQSKGVSKNKECFFLETRFMEERGCQEFSEMVTHIEKQPMDLAGAVWGGVKNEGAGKELLKRSVLGGRRGRPPFSN